jgi:hypothetical protein
MWGGTHVGPTFNGPMDMRQQITASSFSIGSATENCPAKPYQPFRPERRATADCKGVKNVCGIFTKNVVVGNDARDFSRSAGVHSPIAQSHYQRQADSRGYSNKWARETGDIRVGTNGRDFSTANQIINSVDHNCNTKIPRSQLIIRKQGQSLDRCRGYESVTSAWTFVMLVCYRLLSQMGSSSRISIWQMLKQQSANRIFRRAHLIHTPSVDSSTILA